mmetsp:Transcript_84009/g.166858  ORF Transcript_84009/g.166858 Transcript_84009/m.166858 type:complete len:107 (+) Transcript_84009:16-336(+)
MMTIKTLVPTPDCLLYTMLTSKSDLLSRTMLRQPAQHLVYTTEGARPCVYSALPLEWASVSYNVVGCSSPVPRVPVCSVVDAACLHTSYHESPLQDWMHLSPQNNP